MLTGWIACMFGLSLVAHSQAIPTASRWGSSLQIGIGASIVNPDYGEKKDKGPTIYGTFDFTRHIGIEGDVHLASVIAPADVGENTYLLGPRYVFHHGRFHPYAKGLLGLGVINFQPDNRPHTSATYVAYALGGGLDIKVARKINVRAIDVEAQSWPGYNPHGLSPFVMTFGVAYSFR